MEIDASVANAAVSVIFVFVVCVSPEVMAMPSCVHGCFLLRTS